MTMESAHRQHDRPSTAMIHGQTVCMNEAVAYACDMLSTAVAPTLAGLYDLTLEAQHAAIVLAQRHHGRIALPADVCITRGQKVWHQALPKENDLKKVSGTVNPTDVKTVPDTLNSLDAKTVPDTLNPSYLVLQCDEQTDRYAISAAHRYAGAVQTQRRVAVWEPPDKTKRNFRGLVDQLLWITGVNPLLGGIDFAQDTPQSCPSLNTLIARQAIDVLIHVGPFEADTTAQRIALGEQTDANAAVSFSIPRRAVAARVMLADTTLQWQCDDPTTAEADPRVALFEKLGGVP